jgi:hypothetical protein
VDLERRTPIELLPDRTASTFSAWLRRYPDIEIIARDRSSEYARGAATASKAIQVADRWHLLLNARQMVERWLAGAHARLRRLPFVRGSPVASGRRTRAYPRTRAEQAASADSQARWQALYEEVRQRHARGETLLAISRTTGLARGTVRKFAQADSFPARAVRQPGPSILDPFLPHLNARLAAGYENATALWCEHCRISALPAHPSRSLVGWPSAERLPQRQQSISGVQPARPAPQRTLRFLLPSSLHGFLCGLRQRLTRRKLPYWPGCDKIPRLQLSLISFSASALSFVNVAVSVRLETVPKPRLRFWQHGLLKLGHPASRLSRPLPPVWSRTVPRFARR